MNRLAALVLAALLALAACGGPTARSSGKLTVATTVGPVTDIVREVVGDRVELVPLIPEGVDSHTFEPSPATVKALAHADVLFMDGLHLEGAILEQAQANMPKGSKIVRLGDLTLPRSRYAYDFSFPKAKGDPNPHLWMDPTYARRWSKIVADVMSERDHAHAAAYRSNQERFGAVVDQLDAAIATSINSIPAGQRKLLTYHDSFAYFSRRYSIPVIGAAQPSDFSEPSAVEVRRLIDEVRANKVPAVFGSEVFPSTVLRQVATETGAVYVDQLRDDELPGSPSSVNHTYVALMVGDVRAITVALGGDARSLDSVPVTRTWR